MNGPGGYYAKWNKSEENKYYYVITYMWNLKNTTGEYKKKADSQI